MYDEKAKSRNACNGEDFLDCPLLLFYYPVHIDRYFGFVLQKLNEYCAIKLNNLIICDLKTMRLKNTTKSVRIRAPFVSKRTSLLRRPADNMAGADRGQAVSAGSVAWFVCDAFVVNFGKIFIMDKRLEAFQQLLNIMDDLRAQCPWDKKQTLESLRHLTIEETYELADAILDNDLQEIKNELGDLMLHIVFYAKIGSEQGAFDITDVLQGINEKLIKRHPHIYGDVKAETAEEVKDNWEKIKLRSGRKQVLSGVPRSLPAMIKAYRIQDKARGVGFDWEKPEQVWEKVLEEMGELRHEVTEGKNPEKLENEFGDLLFALVNYARFIGVNPESALERTNKRFIRRFSHMEEQLRESGRDLKKMSLEQMETLWQEAKKTDT